MKNLILIILNIFSISLSGQINYTLYSKSEVKQDLNYAFEKLTRIHPIFLDKKEFALYQNRLLTTEESLKDSMTQNEVYLILASLFASLNDGHTGVSLPMDQRLQYTKEGGKSFPFFVNIVNGSIYVSFYSGNDCFLFHGGEQLLEINGIDAVDMVHKMEGLYGGKLPTNKQRAIANDFRFLMWLLYGFEGDYEIVTRNNNCEIRKLTVQGIGSAEFVQNIKRMPKTNSENFSFSVNKGNETAIMKIKSFGDLDEFSAFADSAFAEIKKSKVKNLVIDIRNNGGGRSIVVDSLMKYITNKPYAQYQKIEMRISSELKERYKEKYPDRYEWVNGYAIDNLVVSEQNLIQPENNDLCFQGDLFLWTNNTSFSAAATFAGVFKSLNLGTIIGEETGGTIAYYGDFWFLKTPYTGITFYISPKRFIQYGGNDFDRGVIPDYLVTDKGDSIMDFTYKLIGKKQRNANTRYSQ